MFGRIAALMLAMTTAAIAHPVKAEVVANGGGTGWGWAGFMFGTDTPGNYAVRWETSAPTDANSTAIVENYYRGYEIATGNLVDYNENWLTTPNQYSAPGKSGYAFLKIPNPHNTYYAPGNYQFTDLAVYEYNFYVGWIDVLIDSYPIDEPLEFSYSYTVERIGEVPEPGTWALMIMGFGLVGWSARRREAVAAASR